MAQFLSTQIPKPSSAATSFLNSVPLKSFSSTTPQPTSSSPDPQKNTFNSGVFINPHYSKRYKGGEDAECHDDRLICVADGVGGWADSGVDPALYSQKLCDLIAKLYRDGNEVYKMSPRQLLVDAVKLNDETGSCTCCLLVLDEEANLIQSCNLGDSGYMILRGEKGLVGLGGADPNAKELMINFESKEQQHSFNFPFQCGTNGDDPNKAFTLAHKVEHGDIIVLGSDGLWDNLHRTTILDMVRPFVQWSAQNEHGLIKDVSLVAELLAKEAERFSYL